MEKELEDLGLYVEHSQAEDREPIDFEIRTKNTHELIATVWGSEPFKDVDIDCEHGFVEYGDDDEQGECPICGATCDWHYETDGVIRYRVSHEWHKPEQIGGIVGKYIEDLKKSW